jgi:hypothetical protein
MTNTVNEFEVGETYSLDELPENVMNHSGDLEYLSDNLYGIALPDGRQIEFEMAVECTCVWQLDKETGELDEVLKGEKR